MSEQRRPGETGHSADPGNGSIPHPSNGETAGSGTWPDTREPEPGDQPTARGSIPHPSREGGGEEEEGEGSGETSNP